jgi:threonine dehydratase
MVRYEDILEARERIAPFIHRTPVLTCSAIDEVAGRNLYFKGENFQKVGAFKFRGACNAVFKLSEDAAKKGVVTHSSGNHAQALALAARMRGISAHIVMPKTAPGVKKRAVAGYGATIYECEPTLAAREETAAEVMARTGATLIHPFDNDDVIAGQGTCGLELLEEASRHQGIEATSRDRKGAVTFDAVIAPVGGGGLISGTCIAVREWQSGGTAARTESPCHGPIRIFAAEPLGADDAAQSLAAGRVIPQTSPKTIADGLLTSLSDRTFAIIRAHVEKIITVSDDEIIRAMRLIWERMKIIVEPSSATVLAAVLSEQFKSLERADEIKSIGLILSGGNVDLDHLPWGR